MAGFPQAEAPLTPATVTDAADTSPRGPAPDTSGKRVRAIPYKGGTTVVVDAKDFKSNGVTQGKVTWDFRKDNFTVRVANGKNNTLSAEAAEFLTKNYPTSFEYMSS
jgi:hypothetical protein